MTDELKVGDIRQFNPSNMVGKILAIDSDAVWLKRLNMEYYWQESRTKLLISSKSYTQSKKIYLSVWRKEASEIDLLTYHEWSISHTDKPTYDATVLIYKKSGYKCVLEKEIDY